jgi:hypothetical protein
MNMRTVVAALVLGCAALVLASGANYAQDKKDKKEVTLKGTITCNKCDLGNTKACQTVIQVKEDKKDVIYVFDTASHKQHHGDICNTPKKGTVVGTVMDDGKKKTITVSKVTFD